MLLRAVCAWLVLLGGAVFAADLELRPKAQPSEERVAPAAPQPPAQLQTTQPPAESPKDDKPAAEQKPADTLQPPQAEAPPKAESWWQKIVREAPDCKRFSDGCRSCNPNFACSGLPIACQPKEFTCVDPKP